MMNAMTPIVIDIFINADMTLIQLQCHLSFKYYIFGKLPVLSKFDLQTLQ